MDINRISEDVGVRNMEDSRYTELRNLSPLDIPEIKKSLIERERALGHPESKIDENIKNIASVLKLRTFTDSRDPHVQWLGADLRRLAVYELCHLDYTEIEQAVFFDVSKGTIKRDIIENKDILTRQWWRKPTQTSAFQVTKEWESSSSNSTCGKSDDGSDIDSCLDGDGNVV